MSLKVRSTLISIPDDSSAGPNAMLIDDDLLILLGIVCPRSPSDVLPDWIQCRPVNWQRIVDLAERNKVLLLLKEKVEEYGIGIPEADRAYLAFRSRGVMRRQLATLKLNFVVRNRYLDPLGLSYALIKGAALATKLYRSPLTRESCDVDLLLPAVDLATLASALLRDGYRLLNDNWGINDIALFARFVNVIEMQSPTGEILELHRTLDQNGVIFDARELISTKTRMTVSGQDFWVVDDRSMADYVVYHHARHGWSSLHWCIDLLLMDAAQSADSAFAPGKSRAAKYLGPTLQESRILAGNLRALARNGHLDDSTPSRFLEWALSCMASLDPEPRKRSADPDFSYSWQATQAFRLETKLSRARPRIDDVAVLPLPQPLWWIYWIVRPLRGLASKLRKSISRTEASDRPAAFPAGSLNGAEAHPGPSTEVKRGGSGRST